MCSNIMWTVVTVYNESNALFCPYGLGVMQSINSSLAEYTLFCHKASTNNFLSVVIVSGLSLLVGNCKFRFNAHSGCM